MARVEDASTERASKGGQARAAALTAEERAESARRAVKARWAKARATPIISVTVGAPQKGETQQVEIVNAYRDEPLVATEVGSCSLNSDSYVIMPKNQGGSYTQ